jgi:glycosyltransferase involved in cell wall biosynthesis
MKKQDKKLVIAIDANEANTKERVGVHQYSYQILWAIYNLRYLWEKEIEFTILLKDLPKTDLPKEINSWRYRIIPGKSFWVIKNLMPHLIKDREYDLFFSPSHYLPFFSSCPMICAIHDLGYLKFSEQFKFKDIWQLKLWTAISLNISKHIITFSNFTKKDIVRRYPFTSGKVSVIHHGYDKVRFTINNSPNDVRRVMEKYKIDTSYILFLSTLKPSKNIDGLIDAYSLIKKNNANNIPKLVIAGKKGWMYETIFEKVVKLGLEDRVIFTGYVDENDKPALMANAKAFVSPSFWEGFGIHVLEAMAVGTPVVVSNIASFPEIVGTAGIYVDPSDVNSIYLGIKKVLSMSDKEYNKLRKVEILQAEGFSWEKAARETISVFKQVIKKNALL